MALATCVATILEKRCPLRVDAMIPDPLLTSTHAITIDAPPEQVWPWIAQKGASRAGCRHDMCFSQHRIVDARVLDFLKTTRRDGQNGAAVRSVA